MTLSSLGNRTVSLLLSTAGIFLTAVTALVLFYSPVADAQTLNGAGATFPFPVYSQWAYKYNQLTQVRINYNSIGSGGGIAQIKAGTVDFGASDAPLELAELNESGLIQFPMVMGGVVPVVNIQGVKPGTLRLTSDVLADIFLGKITKWNDSRITGINPGVTIPNTSITVVHRADGSGTTWIFTNYLDKVSTEWHDKVGTEKSVSWPVGVGGKGNEGVAAYVQRINGAIGYVEFAYALQNTMTYILLRNQAGQFVEPTIETFQSAAANADWSDAPGFYMVLNDQPGEKSWPITGATFILIHKKQADARKIQQLLSYFSWCFDHGGDVARDLHYVPMPVNVVELVKAQWKSDVTGGSVVWE